MELVRLGNSFQTTSLFRKNNQNIFSQWRNLSASYKGREDELHNFNSMLMYLQTTNKPQDAMRYFYERRDQKKDLNMLSFQSMISSMIQQNEDPVKYEELLQSKKELYGNVKLKPHIYQSILQVYRDNGHYDQIKKITDFMAADGLEVTGPTDYITSALIASNMKSVFESYRVLALEYFALENITKFLEQLSKNKKILGNKHNPLYKDIQRDIKILLKSIDEDLLKNNVQPNAELTKMRFRIYDKIDDLEGLTTCFNEMKQKFPDSIDMGMMDDLLSAVVQMELNNTKATLLVESIVAYIRNCRMKYTLTTCLSLLTFYSRTIKERSYNLIVRYMIVNQLPMSVEHYLSICEDFLRMREYELSEYYMTKLEEQPNLITDKNRNKVQLFKTKLLLRTNHLNKAEIIYGLLEKNVETAGRYTAQLLSNGYIQRAREEFLKYPITYFNDFVKTHMAKWTEECNDKTDAELSKKFDIYTKLNPKPPNIYNNTQK